MPFNIDHIRQRLAKRAAYIRTVREIRSIPLNTALDLDIYPGDAERIAANAVYGPDKTDAQRSAA